MELRKHSFHRELADNKSAASVAITAPRSVMPCLMLPPQQRNSIDGTSHSGTGKKKQTTKKPKPKPTSQQFWHKERSRQLPVCTSIQNPDQEENDSCIVWSKTWYNAFIWPQTQLQFLPSGLPADISFHIGLA